MVIAILTKTLYCIVYVNFINVCMCYNLLNEAIIEITLDWTLALIKLTPMHSKGL